jgi:hypothetical protein
MNFECPRLLKAALPLALLTGTAVADASPSSSEISYLNCSVSNGVRLTSVTGSNPLSVETRWFGLRKTFSAKIADPPTGGLTMVELSDGESTYTMYLPLDRTLVGTTQTVHGEMHTVDTVPIVRFHFRKIGNVACEVQLEN